MSSSAKVPLVVTQSSSEQQAEVPLRPHSLNFLTPDLEAGGGGADLGGQGDATGYNRERRGSKSCLKVSSSDCVDSSGSRSPCLTASSPARRRSVHFNASPVHDVHEVPASEADQANRGCGGLIGPAPFLMSGKEVYVAPSPDTECVDDMDDDEADPEQTKRLALARDIARRQSGGGLEGHHGGHCGGTSPDYLGAASFGKT